MKPHLNGLSAPVCWWRPQQGVVLAQVLLLIMYAVVVGGLVDQVRHLSGFGPPVRWAIVAVAVAGMYLGWRWLSGLEAAAEAPFLRRASRWLVGGLVAITFAWLLVYRYVGGVRGIRAGSLGLPTLLSLEQAGPWVKPLVILVNYFADTWFATLMAILIGSLFLTFLPFVLRQQLAANNFRSLVTGAAIAVPNMFCSCCTAPIASSLYRSGAALSPTLAFSVAAPSLNLVTLVLALALLEPTYGWLRLLLGLVVAIPLTWLAALLGTRWETAARAGRGLRLKVPGWDRFSAFLNRVFASYCELFYFETLLQGEALAAPGRAVRMWLTLAWHIARILVPLMLLGYLLAGVLTLILGQVAAAAYGGGLEAARGYGNSPLGVLVAAAAGTLLMIPSAVEIPVVKGLLDLGLTGPASALLIALPAFSLPAAVIIGGAIGSQKPTLILLLLVFGLSLVTGLIFL